VHVGPPISSAARELGAWLSDDELSMYFGSDRAGTVDIWVSHRDCRDCSWGDAMLLGPNVNSPQSDGGPEVSVDGHYLFFSSNRSGSIAGTDDIWVSYRENVHDDLAWQPAVNLGPYVSTAAQETGPTYTTVGQGPAHLYFSRDGDIYLVEIAHDGTARSPAVAVGELNTAANEAEPSIRGDGKELYFWSNRSGSLGTDIWRSTRQDVNEPWAAPERLSSAVNTAQADLSASLSRDGRTLLWSAGMTARPSLGFQDVWMSTRSPGAQLSP
jgi:Tol biopolymer transport system component